MSTVENKREKVIINIYFLRYAKIDRNGATPVPGPTKINVLLLVGHLQNTDKNH